MSVNYHEVSVDTLNAGKFVLSEDVCTPMGVLVAKKGRTVSQSILDRFRVYNIQKVSVQAKENSSTEIKQSEYKDPAIFKEFEKNYFHYTEKIENDFINISKGADVNTSEIKKLGEEIIHTLKFETDIFNYLATLKSKDDLTFTHCLNVSILCQIFGKWLKMSDSEIEMLSTAGLLHDIGKTKINSDLINKKQNFTQKEFKNIQNHVMYSYRMIEKQNIPMDIKLGVLMHHEQVDGKGYITGAKNDEIHKFAKIISVLDIYDALTHERPHRPKWLPLEALEYIQNSTFGKLDFTYATTFVKYVSKSFHDSWVKLNTGEEAKILYINIDNVSKPLIQIDHTILDLRNEPNITITEML